MGPESRIEPWSPNLTTFCFVGFGTARLRRPDAMKTAGSENPNRGGTLPRNRAYGAAVQNRSRSIRWAGKQEKVRPLQGCFFLTSPFIELIRHVELVLANALPEKWVINEKTARKGRLSVATQ